MDKRDDIFIFKLNDKEKLFDYDYLCYIEDKVDDGLCKDEALYLLKWIIYRIEHFLDNGDITYQGLCGMAADLAVSLLNALNISCYALNINYILKNNTSVHAITVANFSNNENSENYIIDPTFRQFLIKDMRVNINNDSKDIVHYPGYFLSLTEEGTNFGTNLLNDGYFCINEDNCKLYFDSFIKYNNQWHNKDTNFGINNGSDYIKELSMCRKHNIWKVNKDILNTPKQLKKIKNNNS